MMNAVVQYSLIFTVLFLAVVYDVRERRIPNILIIGGLIAGVTILALRLTPVSFFESVIGFCVGIAFLIIPFILGGIGAGDVKLLGLIGFFVGISQLINIVLFALFVGAVLSVGTMVAHRYKIYKSGKEVLFSFWNTVFTKRVMLSTEKSLSIPFAIPLCAGACAVLILQWSII